MTQNNNNKSQFLINIQTIIGKLQFWKRFFFFKKNKTNNTNHWRSLMSLSKKDAWPSPYNSLLGFSHIICVNNQTRQCNVQFVILDGLKALSRLKMQTVVRNNKGCNKGETIWACWNHWLITKFDQVRAFHMWVANNCVNDNTLCCWRYQYWFNYWYRFAQEKTQSNRLLIQASITELFSFLHKNFVKNQTMWA